MFYSLIWIALHTPVLLFLIYKWFWLKDERAELKSRLPEVMRLLFRINIGFGGIVLADLFITELLTPMLLAWMDSETKKGWKVSSIDGEKWYLRWTVREPAEFSSWGLYTFGRPDTTLSDRLERLLKISLTIVDNSASYSEFFMKAAEFQEKKTN